MMLSSTIPAPKKTLSTMPMAASSRTRGTYRSPITASTPSTPVVAAPSSSHPICFSPVSRNASAMPGSVAWLSASPSIARLRR
ncbi:MAG: hypothetical protein D6788_02610 [Planctomycetota bacterium]|nr:MAG: hypothetical protein D6788_02610 [Planctomycetota bacterium]